MCGDWSGKTFLVVIFNCQTEIPSFFDDEKYVNLLAALIFGRIDNFIVLFFAQPR